ncbi:hypothetical protein RJT34_13814 [Clitoria ternatea]|uniref:Phospholipase A1 n=1 Tax=Clitoria ternatea TaxID=43366 RepID=A0AAN9JS81_CLITE
MDENIGKKWQEVSRENHWEGVIDLDIDLRRYIIHYSEMAQAIYDAFNTKKTSRYCGSSKYGKRDLFSNHAKYYSVTKFMYATSSIDGLLIPDAFIIILDRVCCCFRPLKYFLITMPLLYSRLLVMSPPILSVAGTQGGRGGFKLEVNYDIALVNKGLDGLKDESNKTRVWFNNLMVHGSSLKSVKMK